MQKEQKNLVSGEEPIVSISFCGDGISELKPGDQMALSQADALFRELDVRYRDMWEEQKSKGLKSWEVGKTEVQLQISFRHQDKPMKYTMRQQLGEGKGSFLDIIQKNTEESVSRGKEMLEEILPFMWSCCEEKEKKAQEIPSVPVPEQDKEMQLLMLGRARMDEISDIMLGGFDQGSLKGQDPAVCRKKLGELMRYIVEDMQAVGGAPDLLEEKVTYLSQALFAFENQPDQGRIQEVERGIIEVQRALDGVETMIKNRVLYLVNGIAPKSRANREVKTLLEAVRQAQEEIRTELQKAVDLDIQTYGRISKTTEEGIRYSNDFFQFYITDKGRVEAKLEAKLPAFLNQDITYSMDQEHNLWMISPVDLPPVDLQSTGSVSGIREKRPELSEAEKEKKSTSIREQPVSEKKGQEKKEQEEGDRDKQNENHGKDGMEEKRWKPDPGRHYLHLPRLDGEGFLEMKSFLKEKKAWYDPESKLWHVKPGSISKKELQEKKIGLVLEFLELPYQSRERFDQTKEFLKSQGARFHPTVKLWYLDPASNTTAIKKYLGITEQSRQPIKDSLEKNKRKLEAEGRSAARKEGKERMDMER